MTRWFALALLAFMLALVVRHVLPGFQLYQESMGKRGLNPSMRMVTSERVRG